MDRMNEFVFLHEGTMVGVFNESMANAIFGDSVNAFGIAYDGKTQDVEYYAKGSHGINEYEFYWTSVETRERNLH